MKSNNHKETTSRCQSPGVSVTPWTMAGSAFVISAVLGLPPSYTIYSQLESDGSSTAPLTLRPMWPSHRKLSQAKKMTKYLPANLSTLLVTLNHCKGDALPASVLKTPPSLILLSATLTSLTSKVLEKLPSCSVHPLPLPRLCASKAGRTAPQGQTPRPSGEDGLPVREHSHSSLEQAEEERLGGELSLYFVPCPKWPKPGA